MDPLAEIRAGIVEGVRQQIRAQQAQQGLAVAAGSTSPLNALGAGSEPERDFAFATGYDTIAGRTTLPFTWGMSVWGDADDVWTGS